MNGQSLTTTASNCATTAYRVGRTFRYLLRDCQRSDRIPGMAHPVGEFQQGIRQATRVPARPHAFFSLAQRERFRHHVVPARPLH
jgi:hypothetical protein